MQQGMPSGSQYGMQSDMQQPYGVPNKGIQMFSLNALTTIQGYGVADSKMNGGSHHVSLNQAQHMMMSGNGVDQQVMQQQRMWTPNGNDSCQMLKQFTSCQLGWRQLKYLLYLSRDTACWWASLFLYSEIDIFCGFRSLFAFTF